MNCTNCSSLLVTAAVDWVDGGGSGTSGNGSGELCANEYCESDDDYIARIEDYIFPSVYEWILIGLHCLVFLVGLVGNFLVCLAVYRNHTMRTVTNMFIVNLVRF